MIKLNGIEVTPTIFPDKTSQVWKLPESFWRLSKWDIEWIFENEAELFHLAQLKDLADFAKAACLLYLPYLPYGRQDKEISNHASFALLTFAKILNAMKFERIVCFDPHSAAAAEYIFNLECSYPEVLVHYIFNDTKSDLVCYPDTGAFNKYRSLIRCPSIRGYKERDQLTGNITKYLLQGETSKDKKILIVDDICDGGATFVLLSKALQDAGAKTINLYVSHGIFSKGTKVLFDAGISRIFTRKGEVK